MKFFIETIGCQMNVNDSDEMAKYLFSCGYEQTDNYLKADIIILNTCSVRFSAEHKAYSFLGRLKEYKEENPDVIIGVAGCMAQYAYKEIKKKCSFVDFVVGAKNIQNFSQIINKVVKLQQTEHKTTKKELFKFITIARGCSNFCTYCIVPFVRGPEISIKDEEIYLQAKEAVENGTKEITLLGQNVNSYNYNGVNFTQLIRKVSKIPDLQRIRFMTNHPKDLSDELIEEIASNNKVCKHIHLPLQSGSDRILKLMNRKYTYQQYKDLVFKIKNKIPDINITSDIIIGFPTETEEDFQATFNASRELQFGGLFIFKYSPRPKTFALQLRDDVSIETKQNRLSVLLEESNIISKNINCNYIGKTVSVLVESYQDNICCGRNSQNLKIFFPSQENLTGKEVNVNIDTALANSLSGKMIL